MAVRNSKIFFITNTQTLNYLISIADRLFMNTILNILSMLFDFTLFGGIVLFVIKFFHHRKNMRAKTQIQNLEAKASMIRMSLKGKVKKKVNTYKSHFVTPVNSGDSIDSHLDLLLENKFESSQDFQNYFDHSKKINSIIKIAIESANDKKKNKSSTSISSPPVEENKQQPISENHIKYEDFMGSDFKNEMAIIRLIKEMADTCLLLNERIIFYNKLNPKSKYKPVEELVFSAMSDVNRIFRENIESLPNLDSNISAHNDQQAA